MVIRRYFFNARLLHANHDPDGSWSRYRFLPHFIVIHGLRVSHMLVGFPGCLVHRVSKPFDQVLNDLLLTSIPDTSIQDLLNNEFFMSIDLNWWWQYIFLCLEPIWSCLILM